MYGLLVLIWSSTWVAIKIGLEDCPPLLGAGVRFALAGLLLLAIAAAQRRPLRTDWVLAGVLALAPFAFAYGLVYWGEQYVPSGLAAVLFGILPLYTALLSTVLLPDEPLRLPLLAGVLIGDRRALARVPRERRARIGREGGARRDRARARAARSRAREHLPEAPRRGTRRRRPERVGHAGRAASSCCRCRR